MSTITFTGLGAGFDANAVIDSLVKVERLPIQTLTTAKNAVTTQLSTLGDLASRLSALGGQADALSGANTLRPMAASSSDPTRVTASAAAGVSAGSWEITVGQLARSETRQSRAFASSGAGAAGAGSVTLSNAAGASMTVSWTAADSLADIAARLTRSAGSIVNASVVTTAGGPRLLVSAKQTGAAQALSVVESGAGLGLGDPGAVVQAAQDAQLTVNGLAIERGTNVISDAISGVTLRLDGTTAAGSSVRVTIAADRTALQQKLQGFVDAYNSVARLVGGQLAYTGQRRGPETLFGDSMVTALARRLSGTIAGTVVGTSSAAQLGIKLGNDGTLTLDGAKLAAALDADPQAAEKLFAGAGGLASAVSTLTRQYTDSSTGLIASAQRVRQTKLRGYDDQIARIDDRAATLQASLRAIYARLDTAMSAFNSQRDYLSALTNARTNGGG